MTANQHAPSVRSAIVAGLITVAIVIAMVNLGFWQLRRHDQVRVQNAAIEARASTLVPLTALPLVNPDAVDFQLISTQGVWRPDQEVLWRGRGRNGVNGFEVLTPLELVDTTGQPTGATLLVDRGWVSVDHDEPPITEVAPPEGIVEVQGILRPSVEQPGFGPQDPDDGVLTHVFHADLARLDRQIDGNLLPMYLRLTSSIPAIGDDVLRPLATIEPDAGPHLGYAMQWFAFSVTAVAAFLAWVFSRVMPARRRTVTLGESL